MNDMQDFRLFVEMAPAGITEEEATFMYGVICNPPNKMPQEHFDFMRSMGRHSLEFFDLVTGWASNYYNMHHEAPKTFKTLKLFVEGITTEFFTKVHEQGGKTGSINLN